MRIGVCCVVASALALGGCVIEVESGSGVEASRVYDGLEAFDSVDVSGGIERVSIRPCEGGCSAVRVTADDNLLDLVEVRVDDGELEVDVDGWVDPRVPIVVQVKAASLRGVEASGGTTVVANGFSSEAFEVDASGGSTVDVDGDLGDVEVEASGGSTVSFVGYARAVRAELSGGSTLRAGLLDAQAMEVDASGGSWAEVCASGDVRVEASGGSSVTRGCAGR
jgi:hypothetical protein